MSTQVHSSPNPDAVDRKPRFRSGAAARLAGMPVNTLRIWERRYSVVSPPKSVSGQRLYSDYDVQRLTCLRTLAEQGHAIGTIAGLPLHELQALMQSWQNGGPGRGATTPTFRLALVGSAWRARLTEGWSLLPFHAVVATASVAEAMAAEAQVVDTLLVHLTSLQEGDVDAVLALAQRYQVRSAAVVYAFGTAAAAQALRAAGVQVVREPLGVVEFQQLLRTLLPGPAADNPITEPDGPIAPEGGMGQRRQGVADYLAAVEAASGNPAAWRWVREPARHTDEHLGLMARLSSTVACECPRHLAEIIMQLSAFETYSDNCQSRTEADAQLHRYLGDMANCARYLFETAIDRLAEAEGWDLPGMLASATTEPSKA